MNIVQTMRELEKSGEVEQIILHTHLNELASLTNFNVTIRSLKETQPKRKTVTDSVWGMDGEYDFSLPETYERRRFDIVFNIYSELGNVQEQRDALVDWLLAADCRGNVSANQVYMMFGKRPNTRYTNLWITIGNLTRTNRYYSALDVTITTDPRYEKDGVMRI